MTNKNKEILDCMQEIGKEKMNFNKLVEDNIIIKKEFDEVVNNPYILTNNLC